MTSDRYGGQDPEREMNELLPVLRSLDDRPGPDPAFVDRLRARLMRQHAASSPTHGFSAESKAGPVPAEPGDAMERGDAGRTGEVSGRGPSADPVVRWNVPVLDDHYFSPRAMVATGGSVFATSWGDPAGDGEGSMVGYALAFDAASGRERRRFRSERPEVETDVSAPAVAGEAVYAGVSNFRTVTVALPACPDQACDEEMPPLPDNGETGYVVALDAATRREAGEPRPTDPPPSLRSWPTGRSTSARATTSCSPSTS